jgi:hypothetical protein
VARGAAAHLRSAMWDGQRLARVWGRGGARLSGTLEDYAFCARALLELAEAELLADEPAAAVAAWRTGCELLAQVRERFVEEVDGRLVFFLAARAEGLLVHRPEAHHDSATPSAAAVAIEALVRVGLVTDDAAALAVAERYLRERLGEPGAAALASGRLLAVLDLLLHHRLVVLSDGAGARELAAAVGRAAAPTTCVVGPWAAASLREGKGAAPDGAAQAYVCRGATCSAPLREPDALIAALRR